MTTNDELARLRAAFAAPAGKAAPEPEACPPSDTIWLAIRGELPPGELRGILDHIATCPACAEDWRIAMAFEEESRTAANAAQAAQAAQAVTAAGKTWHRGWMAAAAAILVAVVWSQIPPPPPVGPPIDRGPQHRVESTLVDNAPLPRQSFTLYWRGIPEAASYNLTVTAVADGIMTPVHEAKGLTSTSYTVPEADLANLKSGTKILWNVTPVSRDGDLLEGPTFRAFVDTVVGAPPR